MIFSKNDIFGGSAPHADGLTAEEYVRRLERERTDSLKTAKIAEFAEIAEPFDANRPTAIAGAGLMGRSIAAAFLRVRLPILLYDTAPDALAAAPGRIADELALQLAGTERPSDIERAEAARRVESLLETTENPADLNRADVIIETIIEKLKVKQRFYRSLAPLLSGKKLLLSNTSTIQITDLAEGLAETAALTPERFCGFHFFHPVRKRSLLEIIRGRATSDETLHRAACLARRIEKRPIHVNDGPGFLVNRLLNPYLDEAMAILCEGVPLERIESVCRRFGMEIGPFRILDEIGLDVAMHSGWTFYKSFPENIASPDLLPAMIASGRLGRKNGRGFFLYETGASWDGDGRPDASLSELIRNVSRFSEAETLYAESGGERIPLNGPNLSDEMIALRIFAGVLLEAGRIVADRIVPDAADADRALIFGLGFPRDKGGITFWADSLGSEKIAALARLLAPLGQKFSPPPAAAY